MKDDFNPQEIHRWLCGPVTAAVTPFTEDYALDLDVLHEHVRFMIDSLVKSPVEKVPKMSGSLYL